MIPEATGITKLIYLLNESGTVVCTTTSEDAANRVYKMYQRTGNPLTSLVIPVSPSFSEATPEKTTTENQGSTEKKTKL